MPEAFNLRRMLEEIVEDEKVSTSKRTKVSQADIKKLIMEQRKDRSGSSDDAEASSTDGHAPTDAVPHDRHDRMETGSDPERTRSSGYHPTSSRPPLPLPGESRKGTPAERLDDGGKEGADSRAMHHQISDGTLPARIILKHRVIPLRVGNRVIELAMEDPRDQTTIQDVENLTGRRVEPVKVEPELLERSLQLFSVGRTEEGFDSASSWEPKAPGFLPTLLEMLVISEGSDLLITQGASPWIKTPLHMETTGLPPVTALDCVRCAKSLMNEGRWERFLAEGVVTLAYQDPVHGRFRVQVYREKGAPSLVLRHIPRRIPTPEELGLPAWAGDLSRLTNGLIVLCSPSGHGKTTTLHALVHQINQQRACHIITLEDPVEVLHEPVRSQISQREIGKDVGTQRHAIKQAVKLGAHVIAVGELTSPGALLEALGAAQSGRLVLAAFEAGGARQALDQLIHSVPRPLQSHAISMMEDVNITVVAQKLLSTGHGAGARPVCEKLQGVAGIRKPSRSREPRS